MTKLSDLILARLRSKGARVIRARDLYKLADGMVESPLRYTDQTLQRMRRGGLIRYDSKLGWSEVDQEAELLEAGRLDGRVAELS
jgi:hypothetical protein